MPRSGLLLVTLVACFQDPGAAGACESGTAGCPCASGSCRDELECTDAGYCLDPNCVDGQRDCPCYGNGTCNSGLVCAAGDYCKPESSDATTAAGTSGTQGSDVTTLDPVSSGDTTPTTTLPTTSDGGSSGGPACVTGHFAPDGTCARYVFVTPTGHGANFGGLSDGDNVCNEEATKDFLPGVYAVFARTDSVAAFDHAGIDAIPGAAFVLRGDPPTVVASSPDALRVDPDDGDLEGLEHAIDRDAAGNPVTPASGLCSSQRDHVWTGFRGNVDPVGDAEAAGTCSGWMGGGTTVTGGTGRFTATGADWVAGTECPCGVVDPASGVSMPTAAHLYCVEQPP